MQQAQRLKPFPGVLHSFLFVVLRYAHCSSHRDAEDSAAIVQRERELEQSNMEWGGDKRVLFNSNYEDKTHCAFRVKILLRRMGCVKESIV